MICLAYGAIQSQLPLTIALCVEGSTGFSDQNRTAPELVTTKSFAPTFDFGEPDSAFIDDDLNLSGGPENKKAQALSTTVGPCLNGDTCQYKNQRCETVKLRICDTVDETVSVP